MDSEQPLSPADQADAKRVEEHLAQLGEHFDTVTILVTKHDGSSEDGTLKIVRGQGNWFARYGQMIEWIRTQDILRKIRLKKWAEENPDEL